MQESTPTFMTRMCLILSNKKDYFLSDFTSSNSASTTSASTVFQLVVALQHRQLVGLVAQHKPSRLVFVMLPSMHSFWLQWFLCRHLLAHLQRLSLPLQFSLFRQHLICRHAQLKIFHAVNHAVCCVTGINQFTQCFVFICMRCCILFHAFDFFFRQA